MNGNINGWGCVYTLQNGGNHTGNFTHTLADTLAFHSTRFNIDTGGTMTGDITSFAFEEDKIITGSLINRFKINLGMQYFLYYNSRYGEVGDENYAASVKGALNNYLYLTPGVTFENYFKVYKYIKIRTQIPSIKNIKNTRVKLGYLPGIQDVKSRNLLPSIDLSIGALLTSKKHNLGIEYRGTIQQHFMKHNLSLVLKIK